MLVQLIRGRTSRPDELRERFEIWNREVRPGSVGFLGSTGGVAPDGKVFVMARFESPEAARRNADRPEQDSWWADTSKLIEDAVFDDSTEVTPFMGGGSDEAGFVQVMTGRTDDPDAVRATGDEMMTYAEQRPDIIGGITVWLDEGRFVDVNYFTSEAEAREGERKELPPEAQALFEKWHSLVSDVEFVDLPDPWLRSA